MEDDRLVAFQKAVEDFETMMSKQEVDMNVVWNLEKAVLALLDEPRLILKAREYLESINPFMRTIILTHAFRYDLFRAIYTGELSIEEYEEMVKRVNEMVREAIEETFKQVFEAVKTPKDMDVIKEHTAPTKEALEFYEELAKDYRKKYGTDDPKELRKLAETTGDLHIEMAAEDMEMYHELLKHRNKEEPRFTMVYERPSKNPWVLEDDEEIDDDYELKKVDDVNGVSSIIENDGRAVTVYIFDRPQRVEIFADQRGWRVNDGTTVFKIDGKEFWVSECEGCEVIETEEDVDKVIPYGESNGVIYPAIKAPEGSLYLTDVAEEGFKVEAQRGYNEFKDKLPITIQQVAKELLKRGKVLFIVHP